MKIASANLQLASSHVAKKSLETHESLRMWVGSQRPNFEGQQRPAAPNPVQISDSGKAAQKVDPAQAQEDAINNDPKMLLIRSMIEALTGYKIKLFDPVAFQNAIQRTASEDNAIAALPQNVTAKPAPDQPAGYGVEYDYHSSYNESESTSFAASGTIKTVDGKSISFDLQLSMQRSYSEESNVSLRLGDAKRQDPLVINFNGTAAQLTDTRFAFDLNADGKTENINFLQSGSGFLALDKNHDGKINDGSELFGPRTGQGFSELAAFDSDNNGWIDENDAIYNDLRIWTKSAQGQDQLQSLQAAKVGAIALTNVSTSFDLKGVSNQTLGQIRSSGIYLQEDGKVGTVQQIDLSVYA